MGKSDRWSKDLQSIWSDMIKKYDNIIDGHIKQCSLMVYQKLLDMYASFIKVSGSDISLKEFASWFELNSEIVEKNGDYVLRMDFRLKEPEKFDINVMNEMALNEWLDDFLNLNTEPQLGDGSFEGIFFQKFDND